jgi:hypothetical protein
MRPKRLRFVLDVSGSMYRFNSEDRRLERCCQIAVMLMEALAPFAHKYSWSIVGHSGDGPVIDFVDYDRPPADAAKRLQVVQKKCDHCLVSPKPETRSACATGARAELPVNPQNPKP